MRLIVHIILLIEPRASSHRTDPSLVHDGYSSVCTGRMECTQGV